MLPEIVLPETKPETEWIGGRAVQKVSPTYSHARMQTLMGAALREWAEGAYGRVGTEWRFRITPSGERTRPLVPDVAFVSYAILPREATAQEFEVPLLAPTVALEILSPDDRPSAVAQKTRDYLAAGTMLVAIVDPQTESVELHDDARVRRLGRGDVFIHESLPGFSLDLTVLFDRAKL